LSIVKKLIEKQGGQIQVWSAPAGGSIFAFTLRKFNAGIPG
jgi:signal transduction histidine kinase